MKIGILGTGRVALTLAEAWSRAGHEIVLGSRQPDSHRDLQYTVDALDDAVADADVVVNATLGSESLATLGGMDAALFDGKILLDVANANTPQFELTYPNSSLAEHLQTALPGARIVKSMNTASMAVMTNPGSIGDSSVFLSGDDTEAKSVVSSLLVDLGWAPEQIVDLGGISSARGTEAYFLLFAAVMQSLNFSTDFNIKLVR